jgi:hypothetical protein
MPQSQAVFCHPVAVQLYVHFVTRENQCDQERSHLGKSSAGGNRHLCAPVGVSRPTTSIARATSSAVVLGIPANANRIYRHTGKR